jgi:PAS domain S-box-containing protein
MPTGPSADATYLLTAVVSSSDDVIIGKDARGVITSWNPAAERILGHIAAEAIGQPFHLVVPPELRQREDAIFGCLRRAGTIDHYETERLHKDGRRIPFVVTVSAIIGADGAFIGGSEIARDLSQKKKLEREAGHLAAIADSSDDAIVSKDLDGTITSWNRGAERLFGLPAEEAIGQSIRIIVPPDRQAEEDQVLATVRRGGIVDHFETVRMHKDGGRVPISLTVSPIRGANGEVIGASKIAHDLSRTQGLQRDALRLAAIVDSSDDAIISKDLNGIVVSWNGAAERMFGFSAAEMVGQSIRLLIPGDRQQEEDEVLSRIRRGERVEHYETVRRRKDGSAIPVSLTVSPIRNAEGKIIGASKIARDIGDRRRAEAERQRLLSIATEASRLKDEFLATLSHELRTPLNIIVGYTHMLRAGLLQTADKQSRAFDVVSRSAASLTRIVEDVLDVSRIVSGKLRLDVRAVELPLLVAQAIDTMRAAADAKGLRLTATLDPAVPAVSGDPERIRQILWNVCSNAVKFTERGGQVEVRLERDHSYVAVVVRDTGIGIDPDFLPHVFERFRQADGGTARLRGGLGLGLAISRDLVELQGARISAASDGLGKGSTFRVEFPIGSDHTVPVDEVSPQAPDEREEFSVPDLAGVHVLAVDDDPDALALAREIIESAGAEVVTATSAADAMTKLECYNPDVLLADLGMPQMDGFELIERVRQSGDARIKHVPALALTAYARSEDRTKALRSGFQLHLSKPIQPGELMAAIGALSGRTNGGSRE